MDDRQIFKKVVSHPIYFLAFGFGAGLARYAPGTWGTLVAIPLYLLMAHYLSPVMYALVLVVAFIFGVFICGRVARALGVHDFGGIVWDEIVGYLITMFLAPEGISWIVLGFILFRLFDIWKPQPIRWIDQRVHGGLGIMLDDVIAALFALIILQAIVFLRG